MVIFELKVDKGATLVFSSVGFKSQEVTAKAMMNITLQEDVQQLRRRSSYRGME